MSACLWCGGEAPKYRDRCEECRLARYAEEDAERKVCQAANELVLAESATRFGLSKKRQDLREAVLEMRAARHALHSRYQTPATAGGAP